MDHITSIKQALIQAGVAYEPSYCRPGITITSATSSTHSIVQPDMASTELLVMDVLNDTIVSFDTVNTVAEVQAMIEVLTKTYSTTTPKALASRLAAGLRRLPCDVGSAIPYITCYAGPGDWACIAEVVDDEQAPGLFISIYDMDGGIIEDTLLTTPEEVDVAVNLIISLYP